jgi:thiol:disulfide interchange protein DsbD
MRKTNINQAKSQGFRATVFIFLCLLCLFSANLFSDEAPSKHEPVKASLIAEDVSIKQGTPFWVAIRLEIQDDWHAYWKNPGGIGTPPSINWQLPEGFSVSEIYWPFPEKFVIYDEVSYVYKNEVWLLARVVPPATLPNDNAITLFGELEWLVCSDSACMPGKKGLSLQLNTTKDLPVADARWAQKFTEARGKLPRKHSEETLAYLKEGHLIVPIPKVISSAGVSTISRVSFFPEKGGIIDVGVEAVLEKEGSKDADYQLVLKTTQNEGDIVDNQVLKGTLVLHPETEDKPAEAWDMEVPIISAETANSIQMFFWALIFAFLGGLLLNLMPCVLPVVSLKVLSFVKLSGQKRSLIFKHSLMFSLGVLVSFWALAGVLLILQAYGESVGWGFQLQEPIFVAALASLLFIFSLTFFRIFEVGTLFASWAGQKQQDHKGKGSLFGSFFSGILATAVATPCTGPFLGSAVGLAVTLPAVYALLIFTFLGLGMASPYLLLSAFPTLIRWIPKPGSWMVTFREIMGFLMMATVLWLIWVFGAQTDLTAVSLLLAGLLFFAIGCWILGKWGTPVQKPLSRYISYTLALSFGALSSYLIIIAAAIAPQNAYSMPTENHIAMNEPMDMQSNRHTQQWQPFSSEKVAALQKQGIPVLIDFTARWCLICQTNHMVLSSAEVQKKLKELGVVTMKADWTRNDPEITQVLRQFGRSGVPLYLLYGTDSEKSPEILPQLLTPDNVLEYLKKIEAQKAESIQENP